MAASPCGSTGPDPAPLSLNHGYAYRERISRGGAALLDHLADRHRHSPREVWAQRIAGGQVRVDGVPAEAATLLLAGQELIWNRPPWEEPAVDGRFEVVFVDDALLAVAKPRGLPTLPGGGFLEHTLLALVQARYPEANPMHRLGRGTSGLVLFARTQDAARCLQSAWRDRTIQKTYRALGGGVAGQDAFSIDTPIGPVAHPLLGTLFAASSAGKPALSHARVLERREDATLFEVDIDTGRPHQIRIHLAAAGHPLVGDPLYGAGGQPLPGRTALPGDGGYFLHAVRLCFPHPVTGSTLDLRADPPPELRVQQESFPDI